MRITKGLTLDAGSSTLQIAYLLENLPQDRPLHFAVEFNFAGLPAGADDRYFSDIDGKRLGQLGTRLDLADVFGLGLIDEWLGIDVGLKMSRPTNFWTFPIETVSQSEGGFELVHQSVVVHAALAGRGRQGRPLERHDADVARHQPRREQPPRRSRGGACDPWHRVGVAVALPPLVVRRLLALPWGGSSFFPRWGGSCTAADIDLDTNDFCFFYLQMYGTSQSEEDQKICQPTSSYRSVRRGRSIVFRISDSMKEISSRRKTGHVRLSKDRQVP